MVRSAAAMLAVLILPSFALAQEPQGTHTVVKDDTLWDLSQRYFSDPFEWRVIWNANRDVVEDPNLIYPDEVLVIPGLPADRTDADRTAEEPTPEEPVEEPDVNAVPEDLIPFGLRQPRPVTVGARTIFYRGSERAATDTSSARQPEYVAVPSDVVYSAPWLVRAPGEPDHDGYIAGFAERGARASTIRSFDHVRIEMPAPARVGAHLQIFRVDRTIPSVGQVVVPTGVATVSVIGDGQVVAVVAKEYARIQPGDFARALPSYAAEAGDHPEPVSGGSEAMIMGFAGNHVLTDIGHVAFLDLGSDDGIAIGDEFILYGEAIPSRAEGRLQVINTTETMASARVLGMKDNVFEQGVIVRLARKMR